MELSCSLFVTVYECVIIGKGKCSFLMTTRPSLLINNFENIFTETLLPLQEEIRFWQLRGLLQSQKPGMEREDYRKQTCLQLGTGCPSLIKSRWLRGKTSQSKKSKQPIKVKPNLRHRQGNANQNRSEPLFPTHQTHKNSAAAPSIHTEVG